MLKVTDQRSNIVEKLGNFLFFCIFLNLEDVKYLMKRLAIR